MEQQVAEAGSYGLLAANDVLAISTLVLALATIALAWITYCYLRETRKIASSGIAAASAALATAEETASLARSTQQATAIETCPALAAAVSVSPVGGGPQPPWSIASAGVKLVNLGRTALMNVEAHMAIGDEAEVRLRQNVMNSEPFTNLAPGGRLELKRKFESDSRWGLDGVPVTVRVVARNVEGRKYVAIFRATCHFTRMLKQNQELERVMEGEAEAELVSCTPAPNAERDGS